MQLNPHQYKKGAAIAAKYPSIPVIVNHLGTPTLADLCEADGKSTVFWDGMEALAAAGPHVYLKISMLCYTDPKWDENAVVAAAVGRLIKLFGSGRCFFASNYPVDMLPDQGLWTRAYAMRCEQFVAAAFAGWCAICCVLSHVCSL
jgi:predicted TIM-barrel fold metal-dependent hydrolase